MNLFLKNCLLLNRIVNFCSKKQKILSYFLFFNFHVSYSQISNYVSNGSFEDCLNCNSSTQILIARYWSALDTSKYFGFNLTALPPSGQVPNSSFTHQWPRNGNNYLLSTLFFKPFTALSGRGYPRNRLKQTLQIGRTYCVKIYYNITNQSSYGVDGFGVYFGDSTLDTITQCDKAITFLTPMIQNPNNNILSDTLNWSLLTGTFVASGNEKYMILGNFRSDAATNTLVINPANLPVAFTDVLYDDVSVIDIDLPAYAGPDVWGAPTTTVYLGRERDVGIDEACMWYKLPNTTTPIDTAAGITATVGVTTDTYVVRQEICGNVKWDTVTVNISGVGFGSSGNATLSNVGSSAVENPIRLYPNPVNNSLNVEILLAKPDSYWALETTTLKITNNLGQLIREEDAVFKDNTVTIQTNDLKNGIYFLTLSNNKFGSIRKRFVVSR